MFDFLILDAKLDRIHSILKKATHFKKSLSSSENHDLLFSQFDIANLCHSIPKMVIYRTNTYTASSRAKRNDPVSHAMAFVCGSLASRSLLAKAGGLPQRVPRFAMTADY
jgi:hypothetical protein